MANYNSKNILLVGLKGEAGGVSVHSELTGRDADNQHPISAITGLQTALGEKEEADNKVTSLSSSSTDTQYPSAKCVYDIVGNIEAALGALL